VALALPQQGDAGWWEGQGGECGWGGEAGESRSVRRWRDRGEEHVVGNGIDARIVFDDVAKAAVFEELPVGFGERRIVGVPETIAVAQSLELALHDGQDPFADKGLGPSQPMPAVITGNIK